MAKGRFDWVTDTRGQTGDIAPLECWDEMAAFTERCIEVADMSSIPIFTEHASAIYAHLHEQSKQTRKTMLLIERHQRLANLIAMHEASNPIDFYFIKLPAWLASEYLHRRQERRIQNV